MQTEVTLSMTEAEYVVLSQSIRDLILIKNVLEYLNQLISFDSKQINIYSTLFKDNSRALQLATEPKYRPYIKYICIIY